MKVTRISRLTGLTHTMEIPGLTLMMIERWRSGVMAQHAFVGISAPLREFLITGITPSEWEKVFGYACPDEPDEPVEPAKPSAPKFHYRERTINGVVGMEWVEIK
jgi:hypothetical protein